MATIDFGIDGVGVDAGQGFASYDGPLPPKGTYRGFLKRLELKKTGPNSKTPGTPMLFLIFEIKEPAGSGKEKYNGASCLSNQMITQQSAGFVNQFLHALGGTTERGRKLEKLFWGGKANVVKDEKGKEHINKIGPFVVGKPGEVNLPIALQVDHTTYQGNERLEAKRWFPAPTDEDARDDSDDVIEASEDDVIVDGAKEAGDDNLDSVSTDSTEIISDLDEDDPF